MNLEDYLSFIPGLKNIDFRIIRDGQHIIIVGAGISGLTLAYLLKSLGYKVTVLERADRPGGRIHTVRFPNPHNPDAELYLEAGAMRFSKSRHPLTSFFMEHFQLPTRPFNIGEDNTYYAVDGALLPKKDFKPGHFDSFLHKVFEEMTVSEILEHVLAEPSRLFEQHDRATALRYLIEQYDHHSIESFLFSQGLDRAAIRLLTSMWGVGGRLHNSFVEFALQYIERHYHDLVYMTEGSDSLIKAFVQNIEEERILLNSEVTCVKQNSAGIRIYFRNTLSKEPPPLSPLEGDKVIITAPLPQATLIQVEGIHFGKNRDWRKEIAMRQANSGEAIKILSIYRKPFWKDHGIRTGQIVFDKGFGVMVIPEAGQDPLGKAGASLITYAWGNDSKHYHLSKEERIDRARRAIRHIFPEEGEFFVGADLFDWTLLAGGIGPLFMPGELSNGSFHDLLRPIGKTYFVGDYCSIGKRRWVEGSLEAVNDTIALIVQEDMSS